MADLGEKMTDDRVDRIRSELGKMYSEAARDLQKKVNEYTKRYEAKDKEKRAAVAAGKLSEDDYKRWLKGQVFIGGQWNAKVSQMAKSLVNVEKEAVKIVHGEQVECFAEQANYFEFRIDKDHDFGMNFGLYDTHTVTRLVRDEPELLRRRYVDGVASEAWNVKTIRNCIMQGILQGESIPDIAKRMARDTASSDMKAMTRYARTAMTGAQNAGRLQAMRESKKKGIYCKKLWISALDDRTREAHIDLNGQTADVDKPFDSMLGPIMFPGDPNASDENVWNCRCALGYEYPDNVDSDSMEEYEDEEEEFKDWEEDSGSDVFQDIPKSMTPEEYDEWVKENSTRAVFEGNEEIENDLWLAESNPAGIHYVQSADGSFAINNYWRTDGAISYGGKWDRTVRQGDKMPEQLKRIYERDSADIKKTSGALDRLIQAGKSKAEMVLDRWCGANGLKSFGIDIGSGQMSRFGHARITEGLDHQSIVDQINSKLIGATIKDKAYSSASVCSDRNVFIGSDVKFTILAPAGTSMYVTSNAAESEVILSRNAELEVLGARVIDTKAREKDWDGNIAEKETKSVEILVRLHH